MTDDYELDLLIDPPPVAPTAEEYAARKDAIHGTVPAARPKLTIDDVLGPGGLLARRIDGYEERPEQRAMADLVADCIARAEHTIVEAGTGTGKALDVNTPIPTDRGFRPIGELHVGDVVYDSDGFPTRVTDAFAVMHGRPCYEVVFSDGSTIVADAGHLWYTVTRADRRRHRGIGWAHCGVRTTEQVRSTLRCTHGHANHAIPLCAPVLGEERDLPIAPYTLGAWLGNGTSTGHHVTTCEPEVVAEIQAEGYQTTALPSGRGLYAVDLPNRRSTTRWDDGITRRLRTLDLVGNKHIPWEYMTGSVEQRLALLAGLLDTDGTVNKHGAIEYDSTDETLARDVQSLACSLGYRATLRSKPARLYGKDCGTNWTIQFTTPDPLFLLSRKAQAQQDRLMRYTPRRNSLRYIVDVRPVPSRPVRCIAVDSPDHTYLAGRTYIPTHNSYAYLVPIILSGHKAVVSTANKTLQAQLVLKDLPFLQELFAEAGLAFDYCVAKGKGNYLCRAKVDRGFPSLALAEWAETTATGDIDEAPETLEPQEQARLCAGDDCTGKRCRLADECWYLAARRRRFEVDIVVTNHAQLCQQLANPSARILPPAPVCVVDEAHQLEAYAVAGQSLELSPNAFRGPAREFAGRGEAFLEALGGGRGGGDDVLIPAPAEFPEGVQLATDLELAAGEIEAGRQYALALSSAAGADYAADLDPAEADAKTLHSLADRVECLARPTEPGTVRHVEWREGAPVAKVTRHDVSALLGGLTAHYHTVVYTSATLATGPADFSYFQARNGICRARTLCVASPFDYQAQCQLYLPMEHGMPDPRRARERFDHAVRRQMWLLAQASGGGALLLFTSYAAMGAAADVLSEHLPYPVRRQGEGSRPALIDWLKTTPNAVLCATASFWEGVDVPGDSLRLVAIDKLPFEAPGPVERARQETLGKRAFAELVVPEATLRLKQGFGRLIRSQSDRGVVAILDPRLWTERYGRGIVEALPDAEVVVRIEDVRSFYGVREVAA